MLGIPQYLWRLLPGNPILIRVVAVHGKRLRDTIIRSIYLGALIALVMIQLLGSGTGSGASLDTLSQTSTQIFKQMSLLQLGLVTLLAPVFAAAAITQERDSQTYDILLSTPLTNGQIVLGTLMSRLFFIVALLVSGIPVFSITQIFGGVAIASIAASFFIAVATAAACCAFAIAIATFKVGTRRTIFSFYLVVVIFVLGGVMLDRLDFFKIPIYDAATNKVVDYSGTSYFTPWNPFLALLTIFREPSYTPPGRELLPPNLRGWPTGWMLTRPASFFVWSMLAFSALVVIPATLVLRRIAQSHASFRTWILKKFGLSTGERTHAPRTVWSNPIAWREAKTKASAARSSFLRYAFIIVGLGGIVWLLVLYATSPTTGRSSHSLIPGSYNESSQTLTVMGDQPYAITPQTRVTLDGQVAGTDVLGRRLDVADVQSVITRGTKTATSLTLLTPPRRLTLERLHQFLLGAVALELAAVLLIVTNAAASTVTREKEDGTLDLLLATPITSRYYLWGKLRGLVSFALPLLAVPVASVAIVVAYDQFERLSGNGTILPAVLPESVVLLPGLLVVVVAFAAIVGMELSLRCRTTVQAVMASSGIVIGAFAGLGWCGNLFTSGSTSAASLVFGAFSPFTAISLLIWPDRIGGSAYSPDQAAITRIVVASGVLIATAVYATIVWQMQRGMVKNFDMTIRRQSR